ncbi:mitochondrial large subunit ribosomal protein-domain-containing protein [Diplogelasinospora grovesii]|uniref:Large ribosomal subunit protein mL49 n=1 Tax=Diplogelasinospora grovesii TaxID=303347 RepID=A0AAN6N5W3_9PEZI|nr:mitochondrial large subunit ribosomal protein-domain-containing protein [Diplogelasinospora grovesii]
MLRQVNPFRAATASAARMCWTQQTATLPSFVFTRTLTTESTTPTPTSSETPLSSSTEPASASRTQPTRLPYLIGRTPSNSYPVYQVAKRGGNYKLTTIKKVEGDKRAFQRSLAQDLGLELDQVGVKHPTGHIEVVGHRRNQIIEWLQKQGL